MTQKPRPEKTGFFCFFRNMIRPPSLQKNDTIGIIAPGKKIEPGTVEEASRIIESWGLRVQISKNIFSTKHSYMAGTDDERLEDLQTMLDNPSVNAILCARGGYGLTRIIDRLDFNGFLKKPKWIGGFSDVTALHLKLQSLGVCSIHGTMPILFSKSESTSSVESLRKILQEGILPSISAVFDTANKMGEASGSVVGGNLSLITDSLATPSEIDTKNKILIIEEIDEYFYKIDRMMVQLKRANKLTNLAGLVVGYMSELKETELPFGESAKEIILNHVKEFRYPVAFGFPTGHENPNLAWVEGSRATLKVTPENSQLTFA
ncbi:MAG: LD-carboxypeptidase [Cyclobacteriaceae bacterium]